MRAPWWFLLVAASCRASAPAPAPAPNPAPAPQPPAVDPTATLPAPNRPLTAGERALLAPLFRDGIDYAAVRVIDAPFPFQPTDTYMTPRGHLYAPGRLFRADFSTQSGWERALFVHEMTHVWQYANGIDLVAAGVADFVKYRGQYERAYPYTLDAARDLADYGMEQQASIVEDYYLVTAAGEAPQRLENRGLAAADRDALYGKVLARFLADARYARSLSAHDVAKRHAEAAERTPDRPAQCKETPAEHGESHLCGWRMPRH